MNFSRLFLPGTTIAVLMVVFLFQSSVCFGQDDSVKVEKPVVIERDPVVIQTGDTVAIKSYAERFNPRKALLFAAVVPGLGQIYNKKYWKLPLVYGGFAAIAWNISRYNDIYKRYKNDLFANLEAGYIDDTDFDPNVGITTGQYRTVVNKAQRERDFWVIMMGAMYLLQIVDAHVDAHLKEFDLNPNLQVSVEPIMEQNQMLGRQTGMSLLIRF
jgi:hypothetical protein